MISKRKRTARIRETCENREDPDCDDWPPANPREPCAEENGEPKCENDSELNRLLADQSALRNAGWAESLVGVGAAMKIGVVVCEVGADLNQQRAKKRREKYERAKLCSFTQRGTRAD